MARGRFISRSICTDKAVNDLSSDLVRLTFTWLIPFADCEGKLCVDADLVKSALFPRRRDVTPDKVEAMLDEIEAAGLLVRFNYAGDVYAQFPSFAKHQVGLRKDREAPSEIPDPD